MHVTKPAWFNYLTVIESFREFIKKCSSDSGVRLCLILDNAPWHKKAIRLIQTEQLPEYADIRERLLLVSLPPYSPDLNPIEQCWRVTRREVTHNTYFPNKETLGTTLDAYFAQFDRPNEKFRFLCDFKYKD